MNDKKEMIKKFDDLFTETVKKENFFQFDRKLLLDYMSIQESLPFQNYFKNQIIRLIKPDSLKNYLFLEKGIENIDIFDFIKNHILKEKNLKDKKENNNLNIEGGSQNQKNSDTNAQINIQGNDGRNKEKRKHKKKDKNKNNSKNTTKISKFKNEGDGEILENINNKEDAKKGSKAINTNVDPKKLNTQNSKEDSKEIREQEKSNEIYGKEKYESSQRQEDLKSKISEDSSKINISQKESKRREKSEKDSIFINKNDKNNVSLNSDLSINLEYIQNKLEKEENDIIEIIRQKENLLEQIIKENKKSNNKRLQFFADTNNLLGDQFENAGIKYIFELINCLSLNQDFYFYCNIQNNFDDLNTFLSEYNLEKIEKIQIDFVISDLKIIDFINMLIYLYPNIINLNSLKNEPLKKGTIFQKLVELRQKYKNSKDRIDIFGEIGANIFNEVEKIEQYKKYSLINSYIEKYMNKNDKIVDYILEKCKMKKNNKKIVVFLTNGEYSDIYNKNFKNKQVIKIQEEYKMNYLIIYLNNIFNSKEKNMIDYLILNHGLNNRKMEFIEQLIDLKKKKLNQSMINDKFKKVSLELNKIEMKLRTIERVYAKFIKEQNINLMMNKFAMLFLKKENTVNKYMKSKYKEIVDIELSEKIYDDYMLDIILLHDENKKLDEAIFEELKIYKDEQLTDIRIYNLCYSYPLLSSFSSSFFKNYQDDLTWKKNKKINIIIFLYQKLGELAYLENLLLNIRPNYLSYLYIIQTNKSIENSYSSYFTPNHIKLYEYKTYEKIKEDEEIRNNEIIENNLNNEYNKDEENRKNIDAQENQENIEDIKINEFLSDIKNDIINKFDEIKKNYKEFNIIRLKYEKIIQEYRKFYEHKLIEKSKDNILEKNQLYDKIEYQQELFISKIAQDLSFILSLSLENKDKIKKLFEKDLKKNMNEINKNTTELFLNDQKITNELSTILNKFMQILKENDKNNVLQKLNEKEHIFEFNDEIISINGIQAIYNDNGTEIEINEDNSYKDTFVDILNNLNPISNHEINIDNNDKINNNINDESENKLDNESNASSKLKQDIKSDNKDNKSDNENTFEISLLIEDIKEKIKKAIILINLKLFYKFFCRNVNKIFINNVSRLLSKNVIEK